MALLSRYGDSHIGTICFCFYILRIRSIVSIASFGFLHTKIGIPHSWIIGKTRGCSLVRVVSSVFISMKNA